MPVTFEQFAQAYADENIAIDSRIVNAGQRGSPSIWQSMFDTATLMAPFVEAGMLLRGNPDIELVERPLQQRFPRGTFAHALRLLLNTTVRRQQIRPAAFNFTSGPIGEIDACAEAELLFMGLAHHLTGGHQPQPTCDIFVFRDRPAILRKNRGYGAPSALSLARLTINGVIYPPYSLLRVEAQGDRWVVNKKGTNILKDRPHRIWQRPVSDITGLGFMRVTPFTLPLSQRSEHFSELLSWEEEVYESQTLRLAVKNAFDG